jgi:hypothetical protein
VIITAGRLGKQLCWSEPWMRFSARTVFDDDTFDTTFGGLVTANAEGRVVSEHDATGIPFTREAVARFAEGGEPMQAAGAAALSLAWQHRAKLLNR